MARILAVDYGKKRTGLAVTDPLQIIASGLTTVETGKLMAFIKDYVARHEVEMIVVGLPRTVTGEYSDSFAYIAPFVERLKEQLPEVEVVYHDERFTTKMAMQSMIAAGAPRRQRNNKSGVVDMVSAAIILQSFIDISDM
ncbi:MAG: Holliday junction resolvase RuvX, partial [Rikenellaceae bacterium]|nr:Holliday junction resolvase RuvX [Rikenellaceae bacterium]